MLDDVVWCPRQIDHAGDPAVEVNWYGDEDTHPGAAADRIERWRRLVGDPQPERAGITAGKRLANLGDVAERQADLFAAGNDDALGIEQPEAGKRGFLRLGKNTRKARADRREDGIDGGGHPHRPRRQNPVGGEIKARLDRPVGRGRIIISAGRNGHAELFGRNAGVADLLRIDSGKRGTLRDQFGLGLADQLVLVKPEEEQADQRQRHHHDQDGNDDRREARPPFLRAHVPHLPSRKPTPWTVSIASVQPAAASLARMLRMWLSTVRPATWMLAA